MSTFVVKNSYDFGAHSYPTTCVVLGTRNPRLLVSGGEDRRVRLWHLGSTAAKPLLVLSGHASAVSAVDLDAQEQLVVAGSAGGTVKLWDLEHQKIVRTLLAHKARVTAVKFHPFGDYFASMAANGELRVWDVRRKGVVHAFSIDAGERNGIIEFTPDGRSLLAAPRGAGGALAVVELGTNQQAFVIPGTNNVEHFAIDKATTSRPEMAVVVVVLVLVPRGIDDNGASSASACVCTFDLATRTLLNRIDVGSAFVPNTLLRITLAPACPGKPLLCCSSNNNNNNNNSSQRESVPVPVPAVGVAYPWSSDATDAAVAWEPATRTTLVAASANGMFISVSFTECMQPESRLRAPAHANAGAPPITKVYPVLPPLIAVKSELQALLGRTAHDAPLDLDFTAFERGRIVSNRANHRGSVGASAGAVKRILGARLDALTRARAAWSGGALAVVRAVNSGPPATGAQAEILRMLAREPRLLTLNNCLHFLPWVIELLLYPIADYITTACQAAQCVKRAFGDLIDGTLAQRPGVGVDLKFDERKEKCEKCASMLGDVAQLLREAAGGLDFTREPATQRVVEATIAMLGEKE